MSIYAVEPLPGLLRIGFATDISARFNAHGFPFTASRACVLRLPKALDRLAERFAQQTMWCKGRCLAATGTGGRRTTDWFQADISVGRRALHATQKFLGGVLESRDELRSWQHKIASHKRTPKERLEEFQIRPLALRRHAYCLYAVSSVTAGAVVGVQPSSCREEWFDVARRLAAASGPMPADNWSTLPVRCLAIPDDASPETYEALLCYLGNRGAQPQKKLTCGPGSRWAVFERRWQSTISRGFRSLAKVLGSEFVVEPRDLPSLS